MIKAKGKYALSPTGRRPSHPEMQFIKPAPSEELDPIWDMMEEMRKRLNFVTGIGDMYLVGQPTKTAPNAYASYYGTSSTDLILYDEASSVDEWSHDFDRGPKKSKTHAWSRQGDPIPDPNPFNKPISSPSAGTRAKLRAKRKKSK